MKTLSHIRHWSRMRPALTLAFAVALFCLSSLAQAAYYLHSTTTFNWVPSTGFTPASWTNAAQCSGSGAPGDDDITAPIPLGFTFNFGGTAYTSVRIMSNGRLQFNNTFCGYGTQNVGPPRTYPYPYPNNNLVRTMRVYGADLDPSSGGTVSYATLGSGNNHRFVVSFDNVPEWNAAGSYFNLQIILYENGEFVYQFGPSSNPSRGTAQIGWELSTADYDLVSYSNIGALNGTAIRFYTPPPIAYYAMDTFKWNGSAGEVIDGSGKGHNGTAIGRAQTTPRGQVCRGGDIPQHNQKTDTNAIDTGINVGTDIGPQGSIDFWYKSDPNTKPNEDLVLFDASTCGGGGPCHYFFMDLYRGSLGFMVQDSNGRNVGVYTANNTIPGNSWVHIAATWDLPNRRLQLYVNGALARSVTNSQLASQLAPTDTLYLGDNRTGGAAAYYGLGVDSASGVLDEARIYNSVIGATQVNADMNSTHPCTTGQINHFLILHSGTGLTCTPATVTVQACADASAACTNLYTGSVTVNLSPSGPNTHWTSGSTQTFSGGGTSLSFHQTSPATVSLGVSGSTPAAQAPTQCLDTSTGSTSCNMTFFDSGFVYSIPSPQVAAATSAPITISAVRKDNTSQACVPAFANRTASVSFWSSYVTPASGTLPVTLNNGSNNFVLGTAAPGTAVPISFDANGQSTFTVNYPDAGLLSLNSQFSGSGDEAGLTMTGTASWVSVPARLEVTSPDANADCIPAAPACSKFVAAGQPFRLRVRALNANNAVTPNFQDNNVQLSSTLIAPSGGSAGNLGVSTVAISPTDQGSHTLANQSLSEVGVFTITAEDRNYFSTFIGSAGYPGYPTGTSANIGRFYPDHFCVDTPALFNRTDPATRAACTNSFSYLGELFTSTLSLRAQPMGAACTGPAVTRNYTGAWSKFSAPFSDNYTLPAEAGKWNYAAVNAPGGTPLDLSARLANDAASCTPASGQFTNGSISLSCRLKVLRQGSSPAYTPEAPLTAVHLGINPLDTDGVGLLPADKTLNIGATGYADVGSTRLYFGRLFADNAYGSEQLPLAMWARTQYCASVSGGQCAAWTDNNADTCSLFSVLPPTDTALGNTAANDGSGYYLRPNPAAPNSYDFSASGGSLYAPDSLGHSAGWQLWYTVPGGSGGNYTIPFANHPYLTTQPGTASFGQYRGDDRIIYWREINQ